MPYHYEPHTVGTLISHLEKRPATLVIKGVTDDSDSYRGMYEHVALEPGETTAGALLAHLRAKLGTTMQGYKGGDYTYSENSYVFVAEYGNTGPLLAGITVKGEVVTVSYTYL